MKVSWHCADAYAVTMATNVDTLDIDYAVCTNLQNDSEKKSIIRIGFENQTEYVSSVKLWHSSIIIYSPSCHFAPLCLSFFNRTQLSIQWKSMAFKSAKIIRVSNDDRIVIFGLNQNYSTAFVAVLYVFLILWKTFLKIIL